MSLGVFFLILNYVFQETQLGRSLRPQRPLLPAARTARRARPPPVNSRCCLKNLRLTIFLIKVVKNK